MQVALAARVLYRQMPGGSQTERVHGNANLGITNTFRHVLFALRAPHAIKENTLHCVIKTQELHVLHAQTNPPTPTTPEVARKAIPIATGHAMVVTTETELYVLHALLDPIALPDL